MIVKCGARWGDGPIGGQVSLLSDGPNEEIQVSCLLPDYCCLGNCSRTHTHTHTYTHTHKHTHTHTRAVRIKLSKNIVRFYLKNNYQQ